MLKAARPLSGDEGAPLPHSGLSSTHTLGPAGDACAHAPELHKVLRVLHSEATSIPVPPRMLPAWKTCLP